jgi:hypothetical protein
MLDQDGKTGESGGRKGCDIHWYTVYDNKGKRRKRNPDSLLTVLTPFTAKNSLLKLQAKQPAAISCTSVTSPRNNVKTAHHSNPPASGSAAPGVTSQQLETFGNVCCCPWNASLRRRHLQLGTPKLQWWGAAWAQPCEPIQRPHQAIVRWLVDVLLWNRFAQNLEKIRKAYKLI